MSSPPGIETDALADQRDFRMLLVAPDEACETGLARAGAPNGVEQREILVEKRIALDDADVGLEGPAEALKRAR